MAQKKKEVKKAYKNPAKTKWGTALILILAGSMVLVSVATLIYYIITNFTTV